MEIPDIQSEISYKTSRSGGKGGQNVNKVESRVEARWQVSNSTHVSEEQKSILIRKLANKLSSEGYLSVIASDSRSQLENKALATQRLLSIVGKALIIQQKRRKTAIPKAAREKRLSDKKANAEKKAGRRGNFD